MMNNDNLNLLVYLSGVAGLSASIGSAGANIFNYYLISRGLRRISSGDKDAAKNIATRCLEEINKKSWISQNYNELGLKLAYERFLEKNK